MHCHLVGLNHAHQLEGSKHGAPGAFNQYLTRFCADEDIDLLAEELSEEAVSLWQATGSVAKTVAKRISINHMFCDPQLADRRRLGIRTADEIASDLGYGRFLTPAQEAIRTAEERNSWPIREQFWFEELSRVSFKRCAYILGSEHVTTFGALLTNKGFQVHIAHPNWGP
jgi:hypothetical protein